MKNEIVTLKRVSTVKDSDGYDNEKISEETTVFAEKKSVTRAEFYTALSAGVTATAVFVVNALDYAEQNELLHNGKNYTVVRTFQVNQDDIEITCSDKAVS